MEGATLTGTHARPPRLARLTAVPVSTWAKLGFAALCLAALIGFLAYPTYPIYDSEYYLLWGREILHAQLPSFNVYRAPTEHPLGVAFGTVLAVLGGDLALRALVACSIACFLALAAGLYRLARTAFTVPVAIVAVILLCTRFDIEFLAARGYIDIAFLACVLWAAAFEVERARRGGIVFALLLAAELMRPDAWLLAGLYWLWCLPATSMRTRARRAVIVALGPLLWAALDLLATGDPLWSLHATNDLAVSLGRNLPISAVPGVTQQYLVRLIKAPLLLGGIAGVFLSALLVPRRMWTSLAVLLGGLGTFVLIAAGGLSVINRYLLLPAIMLIGFCAYALAGWTMLEQGWLRRGWMAAAAAAATFGVLSAATTVNLTGFQTELGFRGGAHSTLVQILRKPAVVAALRCAPLSVPNHKLVPDARWILDRGAGGVIARSEARVTATGVTGKLRAAVARSVALYPLGLALTRFALVTSADDPFDQIPLTLPGFVPIATSAYYSAYAPLHHC